MGEIKTRAQRIGEAAQAYQDKKMAACLKRDCILREVKQQIPESNGDAALHVETVTRQACALELEAAWHVFEADIRAALGVSSRDDLIGNS